LRKFITAVEGHYPKAQIIEEMREKFEQLDLDFDEVMGLNRGKRGKSTLPPKYRSPDGKTWSGRGYPPQWIRDLEEAGGDREDYRISDEAPVRTDQSITVACCEIAQ
jgi:H-NS histone family